VATIASLRESAGRVIRVLTVLKILQMAAHASGLRQTVVVVDVAVRASPGGRHVRAGQWESRLRVIEVRRRPGHGRMARLAGLRESLLRVVRIFRVLEILKMAAHASGHGQVVVVVDVAVCARSRRHAMAARQNESSQRVIELRVQPVVRRVTGFASGRKLTRDVVRILRSLEFFLVTAVAGRRHRGVIAERAILVAVIAGRRRMGTGQREAIHVLIDLLYRHLPAANRVAGLAIRPHLALVDIRVAVGALVADIAEHHLGMAGRARHSFMQAAQRVTGLIVIEFRNRPDRFPAINRVAVLAGQVQIAMRAPRALRSLRRARSRRRHQQKQRNHQTRK